MLNIPTIYVHSNQSSLFPQLEKALLTLAEFVKLASLHAIDDPLLGNAWFSFIGLHTDVIDEQSHIEWFRSHTSKGATSPLLALHTISDFYLSPIPNLGPEGLRALFKFLSLFKGLKKLMLILESTKALKKLDTDFWKAVRRDCPGLETLVLQTPPTASEVTVESLINGTPF
ncbi:hypothetical protein BDN72DRAFT_850622 [Pluteus cervinus]|uniref:Uncharacterized protein n=1 Tax=Pluteus cervinus TaxID=181527 RepID=A0ACD3A4L4_9AGAR|nr:hypothetical protein BDN72DRAFT_850622 [Pluteus cervinus]